NVMAWRSLYRMFVLTGDSPEERGVVACMAALLLFELLLLFKQGSFLDHHVYFAFIMMIGRMDSIMRREKTAELIGQQRRKMWEYYQQVLALQPQRRVAGS
ncbi:MAG: hypothetical protein KDA99_06800, partial [Planctomycetales bacterium]|nr:hypothetical protein [Planctomycetales bacterium]